jgi:hypothetical protein
MYVLVRTGGPPNVTGPGQPSNPTPTPGINFAPDQNVDTLYMSTDGERWEVVGRAPMRRQVSGFGLDQVDALYVSRQDPQRIFRSDGSFSRDGGRTWRNVALQLPSVELRLTGFEMGPGWWLASDWESLYRSVDYGNSWQLLVSGDDFFFSGIRGMAVAPGSNAIFAFYFPDRVTGGPGGHFVREPALMRSTDGGATWSLVKKAWGQRARFTFADNEGRAIYAALSPYYFYSSGSETTRSQDGALLKSTDGGTSWFTTTLGMVVNNVLLDPSDPDHLWAAGDDGLAESHDAGATWQPVRTSPQVGGLIYNDPGSSTTLYAYEARGYSTAGVGVPGAPGGVQRGPLHKSTDGARTWAKLAIPGLPSNYTLRTFAVGRPGQLVVAWTTGEGNLRAPVQLVESRDGGSTWRTLNGLGLDLYFGEELAVDPETGIVRASGCCSRLLTYTTVAEQPDPAFNILWQRQDQPVQNGQARRSWTWGPRPFSTLREPLEGVPGHNRIVQYYDKSRMEVNDPNADRTSPWFVTNGLLTVEMVAGRVQMGVNKWEARPASLLPVAGDLQYSNQPTYASFRGVASYENGNNVEQDRTGAPADRVIDAAGLVRAGGPPTTTVRLAAYDREGGHNIAAPFWEFLNRRGPVLENGRLVERPVLGDWVFVMGRPITEPYWVRSQIDGRGELWVLVQLFERRTLTYTPTNPPEWQVEMGNVGLHYYLWRYGDQQ